MPGENIIIDEVRYAKLRIKDFSRAQVIYNI
jgi:hypothetical protein